MDIENMLNQTAAERYDTALKWAHHESLPPDFGPLPVPTCYWLAENVAVLERYKEWLTDSGASPYSIVIRYLPVAGHALGLNIKPYTEINLDTDLDRTLDYIQAKSTSADWVQVCKHALERFKAFLRHERGMVTVDFPDVDISRYTTGLPDWLVEQLIRFQHLRQANWRSTNLKCKIRSFWNDHTRVWRWLFGRLDGAPGYDTHELTDIKRKHIHDYVDHRLTHSFCAKGINYDVRCFQATLRFLEDREFTIPLSLLTIRGIKEPDRLPRFLTDEQVNRLKDEIEDAVTRAKTKVEKRNALLNRAVFYLFWHAGLRNGEVEDMLMCDVDLSGRRLVVRQGKGKRDRTVYLTDTLVNALQDYMKVRGQGVSDHVILYRNRQVGKDFFRNRIKIAGKRCGVKVTPHQLRHTYATQLVNAGCKVTSIQRLLGHKRLNSTMIYARVHDHTIAEDFYKAMKAVESNSSNKLT